MKNVVLVTFDSLRADHCGFMGYDRDTTPTLDQMAASGTMFANAVAPGPSTPESMPAVLTGTYPADHGAHESTVLARRQHRIGHHMKTRQTLAERFSTHGYTTAAFSPNPYTSTYFGYDNGFDHFEDFMQGSRARLYQGLLDGVLDGTALSSVLPFRVLLNWAQREEVFKPWESFYDEIVQWTNQAPEPYFLWVLLMDTHDPYFTPNSHRTQSGWAMYHANWRLWRQGHEPPFDETTEDRLITAYDDTIRYADDFLKRLTDDLNGDDPLIAVQGDHGEAFGEHGTYGHHPRLYEENVHVPFVITGTENRRLESAISLDRTPNILTSLAIKDEFPPLPEEPARCRTLAGDRLALRGQSWKYYRQPNNDEIYALSNGREEPVEAVELQNVCRRLISRWEEMQSEERRILTASKRFAETES